LIGICNPLTANKRRNFLFCRFFTLAEGLAVLELKAPAGAARTFNATLVWDEYRPYRVPAGNRKGIGESGGDAVP
jgi:hypothetical protein